MADLGGGERTTVRCYKLPAHDQDQPPRCNGVQRHRDSRQARAMTLLAAGPDGRRWESIQSLRALAVLAVVLYHACQWSDAGFKIGAAGVDLFFVISGFVMGLALRDRALTAGAFLRRRLWRIAPAYWLVTLAVLGVALTWPKLLPRVYPEPLHVALSLLLAPHLDPAGLPFPLLPVGWSLSYELIFYGLVAVSLAQADGGLNPRPQHERFARLTWGLIAVMLFGVVVHPAFFLFANPMMLQFLAGAMIARLQGQGRPPGRAAGWGLIVLALALYLGLSRFDLYGSLWRPILWGTPAALLVAGAVSLEGHGVRLGWRPFGLIGAASYSIYLCHWPVVVILASTMGGHPAWLFVVMSSVLAVGAGLLFWRGVERPLLRWSRRWTAHPSTAPAPAEATVQA